MIQLRFCSGNSDGDAGQILKQPKRTRVIKLCVNLGTKQWVGFVRREVNWPSDGIKLWYAVGHGIRRLARSRAHGLAMMHFDVGFAQILRGELRARPRLCPR